MSGVRKRRGSSTADRADPTSTTVQEDPSLPYGGRVVLAKRKKAESWTSIALQMAAVSLAVFLLYVCYFHPATLQFLVTRFYAHLGHSHAQHLVGQKYLRGYGVDSNVDEAIFWLRKAKEQGHPVASYDLAIAHLKGMNASIDEEELPRLLRLAADHGIKGAEETLSHVCSRRDCGSSASSTAEDGGRRKES